MPVTITSRRGRMSAARPRPTLPGINQSEGRALQQADLNVGRVQIGADGIHKQAQDLPIAVG